MLNCKELKKYKRRMTRKPTMAEVVFEKKLKEISLDFKKQVILGFYIIDFVLPDRMICFEIDGDSHNDRLAYDGRRDKFLSSIGFNVIHIKNIDVENYTFSKMLLMPVFENQVFRSALGKANAKRGLSIARVKNIQG